MHHRNNQQKEEEVVVIIISIIATTNRRRRRWSSSSSASSSTIWWNAPNIDVNDNLDDFSLILVDGRVIAWRFCGFAQCRTVTFYCEEIQVLDGTEVSYAMGRGGMLCVGEAYVVIARGCGVFEEKWFEVVQEW
jgi:hypothetical protein